MHRHRRCPCRRRILRQRHPGKHPRPRACRDRSGVTTIQPRIERAVGARQTDRHTRLQDAIAGGDPTLLPIVTGRFSGCAIAPTNCRATSRGNCVSVSRVMTYFTVDRIAVSPTTSEKSSAGRPPPIAAQQGVEGFELAALALVAHPHPFLRIPQPRTVEEIEDIASALPRADRISGSVPRPARGPAPPARHRRASSPAARRGNR